SPLGHLARLLARDGSQAGAASSRSHVRFTPKSGQTAELSPCPLCAKSDLTRCSKNHVHSITSSAMASNEGGMLTPRDLAVLRLMNSSTFVDCWTGKSAGFSPLRIRPE